MCPSFIFKAQHLNSCRVISLVDFTTVTTKFLLSIDIVFFVRKVEKVRGNFCQAEDKVYRRWSLKRSLKSQSRNGTNENIDFVYFLFTH